MGTLWQDLALTAGIKMQTSKSGFGSKKESEERQ